MRTPWLSYWATLQRAPTGLWSSLGRVQAYGEVLTGSLLAPAAVSRMTARWRDAAACALGDIRTDAPEEVAAAVAALYDAVERRDGPAFESRLTPQSLTRDNAALAEIAAAADPDAAAAPSLANQLAGGGWGPLSQCCDWLNGQEFRPAPGEALQTALLRAIAAEVYIPILSPFTAASRATARVAGYRILRAAGLPAMAAHLPAAHFAANAERHEELQAEAVEAGAATIDFVTDAVAGVIDGLRTQLDELRGFQADGAWRELVRQAFAGRNRVNDRRRLLLLEDLAAEASPVRIGRLRRLTPRLAEAYAGKSEKTLSRDVKWLEAAGLLRRTLQGVRPRTEALTAFAAAA